MLWTRGGGQNRSPQLKRRQWYCNHDQMEVRRRRNTVFGIVLAIAIAGCATAVARSQVATPDVAPSQPAAAGATSEPLPADSAPADAKQAFVEGYRAYVGHDYPKAIIKLTSAASQYPALGDYALYYLAEAQSQQGDLAGASAIFERLRAEYPQSVLLGPAELSLAQIFLKLGKPGDALSVATHLVATTKDASLEQNARFAEAQALDATGRHQDAYQQSMLIRETYPRGEADSKARALAYSIRATNPAVVPESGFVYHKSEAALLLREAVPSLALQEAQKALAIAPTSSDRAEALWIEAQALKSESERQKQALLEYLSVAPRGPAAAAVLYDLALIYWKEENSDLARATFGKVVAEFPSSSHAPGAMLRIGRIYEELRQYDEARAEYGRLVDRYPGTEAAEDARFRIPWSLYMAHQYARAASSFEAMHKRAESASEREMFEYWHARALEKSGKAATAHQIFERLAASTESNYYPALAAMRVPGVFADLPAASAPELSVYPTPESASAAVRFHLSRILALRALGIPELEAGEYRALEEAAAAEHSLRSFILAGLQSANAWYDAIIAATRMSKN